MQPANENVPLVSNICQVFYRQLGSFT